MGFMNTINIVGSGLTAQQLRLDIVAENVTNSQTTRTENGGGAYRRKMVVFEAVSGRDTFRDAMARASARAVPNGSSAPTAGGVRVTQIVEDESPLKIVYDPTHPDANEDGYVMYPNVNMTEERVDLMAAANAYDANFTALQIVKTLALKALEIGK